MKTETITRKDFYIEVTETRVRNGRGEEFQKFRAAIYKNGRFFWKILADTPEQARANAEWYIEDHLAYLERKAMRDQKLSVV